MLKLLKYRDMGSKWDDRISRYSQWDGRTSHCSQWDDMIKLGSHMHVGWQDQ